MKFKRIMKPQFLRGIGREMWDGLLGRFGEQLAARKVTRPASHWDEDEYFSALAALTLSPEELPEELVEALFALEELANAEGQERLERAALKAGLSLELPEGASHGDIAMQVYLAQPALVLTQYQ